MLSERGPTPALLPLGVIMYGRLIRNSTLTRAQSTTGQRAVWHAHRDGHLSHHWLPGCRQAADALTRLSGRWRVADADRLQRRAMARVAVGAPARGADAQLETRARVRFAGDRSHPGALPRVPARDPAASRA